MKALINKLKSKVLTHLFKEWVDTEYDLETLKLTKALITLRENELKRALDKVTTVEFKGFREMSKA